jgi:hypothetical protein
MTSGIICLKGVLMTPFILSTEQGNYDVEKESFYQLGETYYFQLDTNVWPWRIIKAVKSS